MKVAKYLTLLIAAVAVVGILPTEALAQEKSKINTGDTAWMLTSTALVLLMTIPGVALFYGGMVRKKNLLHVMMHVFAITCIASVLWVVVGYSLAYSGKGLFVGNLDNLFLKQLTLNAGDAFPESVNIMFQMTFAIITPALIVGAYVERAKFSAMMIFAIVFSVVCYAPIAHWVWGGGWVSKIGALDFAGGTVVHINSGIAGLAAALVIGKRTGYGRENLAPHNIGLSVIGAALLWVGWFGFNAGSAVGANANAGMAMLVTQIASAVAALVWMLAEWITRGKPSVLGIISGAIAGLVAITPASGYVGVMGAFIIGIAAGLICFWAVVWLKRVLGYDDSLDVFGIHGIGGIVGALLTGVFAEKAIGGTAGVIEGNAAQFLPQLWSVLGTVAWTFIVSIVVLKVIDLVIGLRPTEDGEREGLDTFEHGERIE